jgi:uncharacterized SAM-binding protein YcdF (DUF218 family)
MKIVAVIVLAFVASIVAFTIYLMPDDLSRCQARPSTETPCRAVDAVVAVSGGDTEARTNEAITLYENGWAPLLIFSGAAQDKSGPSNAEAMRRIALQAGVPDDVIVIEEYGETTKQNAENTQSIFAQNDISSVILVTSGYHQRRAALEFNARTDVAVRNHPASNDSQWSWWWWATPIGWFLAVSELVKIIAFFIGGSR